MTAEPRRFKLAADDSMWSSNLPGLLPHRDTWILTAPLDPLSALMLRSGVRS